MRRVYKNRTDPNIQREQEKTAPSTVQEADSRWRRYRRNGRRAASQAFLLEEQWRLCAYTELALDNFLHGCHIDHIEPKRLNPGRTFDYYNLVVSALDNESLSRFSKNDRFGGHAKQGKFDPNLFISPLLPDSNRYFQYLSNGKVEPSHDLSPEDREKAVYTRDLLNLNAPFLVNSRRKWLMEIEDEIDRLIDDEPALRHLAECELCDTNGKLREFHSAAKTRFGRLGDQVMVELCKNCLYPDETD